MVIRTLAVVGTGLIGTSVALAAGRHGVRVHLLDRDELAVRTAAALGAGVAGEPDEPVDLAVVAVPPTGIGPVLVDCEARGLARGYTDVASVKQLSLDWVGKLSDPERYIGGHPLAGRERSGPLAARAGLFEGFRWVLTPSSFTSQETRERALELISMCGATPVFTDGAAHDEAVALVSHAPHAVAGLLAGRLCEASPDTLRLAGRGLRDVLRIAAGDPALWSDILTANAPAVVRVLTGLHEDLGTLLAALRAADEHPAGQQRLGELLRRGVDGLHTLSEPSAAPVPVEVVRVPVAGQQGELARLVAVLAGFGVRAEDLAVAADAPHDGLIVEFAVPVGQLVRASRKLAAEGWTAEPRHDDLQQPQPHRDVADLP